MGWVAGVCGVELGEGQREGHYMLARFPETGQRQAVDIWTASVRTWLTLYAGQPSSSMSRAGWAKARRRRRNSSTPGYVSVGMAREYSVRNVETLDKQRVLTDWF